MTGRSYDRAVGSLTVAALMIAFTAHHRGCLGASIHQGKPPRTTMPTQPGVLPALLEIMKHDEVFESLLSERVVLQTGVTEGAAALPKWAEEELLDPANADPLRELRRLMPADEPLRSGRHVALAGMLLGVALRCVTFKRVAVHVALLSRMLALGAEDQATTVRLSVMGHLLVRTVDVLNAVGAAYGELLDVYSLTVEPATMDPIARDELVSGLDLSAEKLNNAIAATCVVSSMRDYVPLLDLIGADGQHFGAESVTADQRIDDSVQMDAVQHLLRVNENMALDSIDRMPMLRTDDMSMWKTLLDVPDLPQNPQDFKRTPQAMSARKREAAEAKAKALQEQKSARALAAAANKLRQSRGDEDATNPIPLQMSQ